MRKHALHLLANRGLLGVGVATRAVAETGVCSPYFSISIEAVLKRAPRGVP